ncbi:MAG TPA: BON domain-containing protein [Longimicrobiales bacterium]|nr:BON domain-containing protein [Longimicrobiales bacterium]
MKDRSSANHERKQTDGRPAKDASREREQETDDSRRFSGDGPGERGYRGDAAPDVPPGSVPGGSYGAGGVYRQGAFSTGDEDTGSETSTGQTSPEDAERGEWRGRSPRAERNRADTPDFSGEFGAYGVRGYDSESPARQGRSGYGEQGFGAGESRGGQWGGGERGGYGGGQPGGLHGTRGGGWAAAGERYEQGRGPRSYGSEGWGANPSQAAGREPNPNEGRGGRTGWAGGSGRVGQRGTQGEPYSGAEAPWRQSEFAGRGEFGDDPRNDPRDDPRSEQAYSSRSAMGAARVDADWTVPGPHSGRGPQGYRRSEAAIRDDVCERLTRHGRVDAGRIQVQVEQGEVTLEGLVDSRIAKRTAEEVAESVSGVRDVHNRLRIDGSDY